MEETPGDSDARKASEREPASDNPLEHVVDDLSAKEQCADWILEQMTAGRTPEEITGELRAQGWDPEEAQALVEYVRKATRRERGLITRDDVVRSANRRYRQSWSPRWLSGMPTLSSGVRLLSGLRNLFALKKVREQARDEERDAHEP